MTDDPFHLERFAAAQSGGTYEQALGELRAGQKQSHWMWFIFPQHRELGRSATARFYGLSGVEEARAYVRHPVLGRRLLECCQAVLPHLYREPVEKIFGPIDALKLRSSMKIFGEAAPEEPLFGEMLQAADVQYR